jgi:hypothetical protein
MYKSGTAGPAKAPHPTPSVQVDQNDALRRARIVDATGAGLKVTEYRDQPRRSFDDVPLRSAREGASVTATVTLDHVRGMNDGHAAGIVSGPGGRAVVAIPADTFAMFAQVLTSGARVTLRGLARTVNGHRTITVTAAAAAKAVAA